MLSWIVPLLQGKTYYIDPTGGNNSNSGLSADNAWQSEVAINGSEILKPGDKILFKRGETLSLTTGITIPCDYLTLGAYGTGAKPIIDGQDTVNCIYALHRTRIALRDLNLIQGYDHCIKFDGCHQSRIVDCDTEGAGNDNIIFIDGCSNCRVEGGTHENAYARVPTYLVSCIEVSDNGGTIIITDVTCQGSEHCGITIHNHNAVDPQGATDIPHDVYIVSSTFQNNGTIGINIMNQEDSEPVNAFILDCTSEGNTQDGLRIAPSGPATGVEYLSGVTIHRLQCLGNGRYAAYVEADNVLITRSVFADNESYFDNCQSLTLYNNTFHNAVDAAAAFYIDGARSQDLTMRNNIIQTDVAGQLIIVVMSSAGTTGWDVDYTLYRRTAGLDTNTHWHWKGSGYSLADWKTQSGGDEHAVYGDALFTGDYTLGAGSPAIDAGVEVSGVTESYLGLAPDIGYAEAE